ncbi:serine/threonine protein kinase [Leptolyngbya sp. NIES-2104]|uniref:serine/threonine protein kinase n=1 Tax=Leptolyngbya sp. NIES-2104 TaxID=1552121 RepID=UPI0006EC9B5E|nr:serine/threonine-protein kinase [Leptolyngbya sp. NIES-2104]GAP96954.1 serine/threonine kinase [Leptolyngbya sp. NIES-2104]
MFQANQVLQERYQLQHPLGRSFQARQTWLATDLATDVYELVVIKLLVFTEIQQWQDLKLFEREAEILKSLDHPRIPRYRNYFLVDPQADSPFCWWGLVQDYIPGTSLKQLIEDRKRFSEEEVRRIAIDILQILHDLHELKPPVLHRDIKPSNLILGANNQVYLVDFGSVQDRATTEGATFTIVGTYGYTPLEQFGGRAVAASDLYGLGATLIHLLTGIAPINLPQRNLRIEFRDRMTDSSFVRWLEKLTEPALENRFTSAREAREALEQGIDSMIPIRDRIQTVSSKQSKKIQRISPHLVIEQTPQILKIKVRERSPNLSDSILPLAFYLFYLAWAFISFTLLPFADGAYAFTLGFILAYLISIGKILWEARDRKDSPASGNSIQFDRRCDHFMVITRSWFSIRRESGRLSAIRYLSITSSQVSTTHTSHRDWTVIIRADQNYRLNWKLTEEESIWLVNEIQTWLNAKK